jgi:hypothetical protein
VIFRRSLKVAIAAAERAPVDVRRFPRPVKEFGGNSGGQSSRIPSLGATPKKRKAAPVDVRRDGGAL